MTGAGWTSDSLKDLTDEQFRQKYNVLETIGVGGTGEVLAAVQRSLDRRVVIKVMRPDSSSELTSLLRFEREGQVLSRLVHPRIVQVYDFGLWEGRPYLVLEYVSGGSLASFLKLGKTLDATEATTVGLRIAEGLAYLHQEGVLHRDIKPGNILLASNLDPKISDFGLARPEGSNTLTEDGMVVGTLRYLPPETLTDGTFSARSDLYSLGVMIYQLFASQLPFRDDQSSIEALISTQVNSPPVPLERHRPELVPPLTALVNRLVAPDPAARPESAEAVARSFRQILADHQPLDEYSREIQETDPESGVTRYRSTNLMKAIELGRRDATRSGVGSGPRERWKLPIIAGSGIILGIGLGILIKSLFGGRAIASHALLPGVDSVRVQVRTTSAVGLGLRYHLPGTNRGRTLPPEEEPAIDHDRIIPDLPPGADVQVWILLPDGSREGPFTTRTIPIGPARLETTREHDRILVELETLSPTRLEVQLHPVRGMDPGGLSMDRDRIAGQTAPGTRHRLSLGPVGPRQDYRLEAWVRLPNDQVHSLEEVLLPNTVDTLLRLAKDVNGLDLARRIVRLEHELTPPTGGMDPVRVYELLDRVRYRERSTELLQAIGPWLGHLGLTIEESVSVYANFQGLRFVDRYLGAWDRSYRTQVEALIPPEMSWSEHPLIEGAQVVTVEDFGEPGRVIGSAVPGASMFEKMAGQDVPNAISATLDLSGDIRSDVVQFRMTVVNPSFYGFRIHFRRPPLSILLVPRIESIRSTQPLRLYHAIPTRKLHRGRFEVSIKAVHLTGDYRNPLDKQLRARFAHLPLHFPHIQEVAILAR